MDAAYAHLQCLIDTALHNNDTEKNLMSGILQEIDKGLHLPVINEYFTKDNRREAKFFLGKALLHLKLHDNDYKAKEVEKLAKNISGLVCGTHKSVVSLLEVQKRILKIIGVPEETRLECLHETLVRVSKSPYPLNKQLMELCKHTLKYLSQNLRMTQFVLCMGLIKKTLHADVHHMILSELLNYVPMHVLVGSTPLLLEYVCAGFCMNITAVQRGYIYKVLLERLYFSDWENYIMRPFVALLDKYQSK